jgi:cell division protein FtsI/penicillin-binding protein 2
VFGDDPRIARRRVALLAGVAFLIGLVVAAAGGSDGRATAERYAAAWSRGDWATMHALLTRDAQRRHPLLRFARENRAVLATATATRVTAGKPEHRGDRWRIPAVVRTRAFGTVTGAVSLELRGEGDAARVAWTPDLAFPGLRRRERLTRDTTMPRRGAILARDGTALARRGDRGSPIPEVASQVVGGLAPIAPDRALELRALGVPPDAQVGASGLERIFEARLGGVPRGTLRAGQRAIARGTGRAGSDVRTTISPDVERAAIAALAGRYGGVVAFDPRDGAVLAFAGIPFSQLQPPGSTFKIITVAGALEAGIATPKDTFPFASEAVLSGVKLANAGGEVCGGTLALAFAVSCNSVFAPLGAKLGAARLVRTAGAFGFDQPPPIAGAAVSTIPPAGEIGDDLAVGSSAIGQGRVEATTLQMAAVAGTIADRGRRPRLTLDLAEARRRSGRRSAARGERAVSERTARRIERLMLGVVRSGTGTAAAIPGVPVAGKTGTAELKSREPGDTTVNPEDTDAWFVSYAPAGRGRPKIVVGVLLVQAGAGGASAAPAARGVLLAGLQRR